MSEYILDVLNQTSKLDWAFPFQRTGAFPLDRSSIFSSLADAEAYALGLSEGGVPEDERGLAGTSYVGQTLSVYEVDNNEVTLYIINADRTLKAVGSMPIGDNASIEVIDNKIQLKGFGKSYFAYHPAEKDDEGNITKPSSYEKVEGFKEGLEPRVIADENGLSLAWYEPSSETIEDISANIEAVNKTVDVLEESIDGEGGLKDQISDIKEEIGQPSSEIGETASGLYKEIEDLQSSKANASDVYTKEETDKAIGDAIAAVDHLERVVVDSIDDIDVSATDAHKYIYMVPTGFQAEDDKYDEYIVINGAIEKVGSWEVDLSGYAKTADVNNALALKVDAQENARLMTNAESDKLSGIETEAEKNIIDGVSGEFNVDENRILSVKSIAQEKITGLVNALNQIIEDIESAVASLGNKVDKVEGSRLITTAEIDRLAAIKDLIQSVDTNAFTIDENGKLLLNSVDISEIEGLVEALFDKVDKVEGSRLITAEEAKKLEALSIDNDGSVGISGTVNASNVQELYNAVVNIVTGTGTGTYDDEPKTLLGIEIGAQKNYIKSVDDNQLNVDDAGKLSVKKLEIANVNELESILNSKATTTYVNEIEASLNALTKSYYDSLSERVETLEDRLTWKDL